MNNKSKINLSNFKLTGFQDYVSVGYLVLLFFGLLRESLYYGFLGINIMKYSSLIDVILSPVVLITKNIFGPIGLILALTFGYGLNKYYTKKAIKKEDEPPLIGVLIFMGLCMFLGMTLGSGGIKGYRTNKIIEAQNSEVDHKIMFSDNQTIEANIVGQNSEYLFYVTENSTEISISPIKGNVKMIERLKDIK